MTPTPNISTILSIILVLLEVGVRGRIFGHMFKSLLQPLCLMSLGPNSVKITFFSIFLQNSLIAGPLHEMDVLGHFWGQFTRFAETWSTTT